INTSREKAESVTHVSGTKRHLSLRSGIGIDLVRVSVACDLAAKVKRKKRILHLADRSVLIDKTMVNDFRPLTTSVPSAVRRPNSPAACNQRSSQHQCWIVHTVWTTRE
ncbi:hypothetical protein, partial [Pseudorhizobium halotolerans]|uniref:hypothetical protein n=1 Tax=Pseudorhizobium halotolerans TaxID=1233081 RepID=UPI001B7D4432